LSFLLDLAAPLTPLMVLPKNSPTGITFIPLLGGGSVHLVVLHRRKAPIGPKGSQQISLQ